MTRKQADRPYLAIARRLQADIAAGVYAPGVALPSRPELAGRFGVARATIERSVDFLVERGFLVARHGVGTYVSHVRPSVRIAVVGEALSSRGEGAWSSPSAHIEVFPFRQMEMASARAVLPRFDGVLWLRPEEKAMAWVDDLRGRVPQVLVNRVVSGFACVSTDHRGAYCGIAEQRLAMLPSARPFFLRQTEISTVVGSYRELGFADACRSSRRYFETIALPVDFEAKLAELEVRLRIDDSPLLLASDALANTGAVMHWVRTHGLRWGKDVWYSDFDNNLPDCIWGVRVTSFIQDDAAIENAGIEKLLNIVSGGGDDGAHILLSPRRRDGET